MNNNESSPVIWCVVDADNKILAIHFRYKGESWINDRIENVIRQVK